MKKNNVKNAHLLYAVGLLFVVSVFVLSFFVVFVWAASPVTVLPNGSRLVAKTEASSASYQWQRADTVDGTFADISGANDFYYDITAVDEGKYIRVKANGTESDPVGPIGKLVVFDLSKGSVTLGATYSGNGGAVTGTHAASNIYVITQSDVSSYSTNTIQFTGAVADPFDVTLSGIHLGSPSKSGHVPNTSYVASYAQGTIDMQPGNQSLAKKVILRLKGENIVRAIHYYTQGNAAGSSLKITDINGDGAIDGGSLYIPVKVPEDQIDAFVNSNASYNHWNSGIGGNDSVSNVTNLEIAGGKLQVLTTYAENCTAIGAGGNGSCTMTISGGEVIAHCNGTGAAIGGGIGWFSAGGTSNITITGGKVYAKNHGKIYVNGSNITSPDKPYDKVVGGVAIGSGSSFNAGGATGTVTIKGGYVEAYGTFGNGIGGGNSSTSTGGKATINISGGTVIASSIGGGDSASGVGGSADVTISGTANVTLSGGIGGGLSQSGNGGSATITVKGGTMTVGGSIGGGAGNEIGNGGDATVKINGGSLTAASIGGGKGGTGGNGGAAEVYVTDGVIKTGSIGGGDTLNTEGSLGYAKADISGGDISGQFLMSEGGTQPCSFIMTGGTLHSVDTGDTSQFIYAQQNGGAVYMNDSRGTVEISGGTIQNCAAENGGAIYMTAGTCTISGEAVIKGCSSTQNGGGVYLGGGEMTVEGGEIKANSAAQNGGGVYLGGGKFTVNGGSITGNSASENGGGAYINGGDVEVTNGSISANTAQNSGGGIAVNNGNYQMTGGNVDGNTAQNGMGGGIYVSANDQNVTVNVYSGSVSDNEATGNGGALAVVGAQDGTEKIEVTVGVNKRHVDDDGNKLSDVPHGRADAVTCPVIKYNSSLASGGGVYVTGNTSTVLNLYCLEEKGSSANADNGQSDFMRVDGGKVTVTTSQHQDEEKQDSNFGNTHVENSIYVTGGQMDLWGDMTNPRISDVITVDIKKEGDYFEDHRITKAYYKLHYYENFTDPITNVTTGQYKSLEIVIGSKVTISGNIYSHPGYTIKGWNTSSGKSDDPLDDYEYGMHPGEATGWFNVSSVYTFDGEPIGDLILYAIWEPNGYTVIYDPNVPAGETYSGNMPSVNFTYDMPTQLDANQFARPGYLFQGWSTTPDGGVEYGDQDTVTNLTTKKGEVVTLYAVWQKCDHNPETHTYTYSANGGTLRRDCECGGYSEQITLTAENTVYDKAEHPVRVYCSSSWSLPVTYRQGDTDVGIPKYAGTYTASVTAGDCTASVTYTIAKADQSAPAEKPKFDANIDADGSILSVYPVPNSPLTGTDGYDSYAEYRVVYYANGVEYSTEWIKGSDLEGGYAAKFELNVALTNYYIYARYSEGANYNASPQIAADSVYFFTGNVKVEVICGEGIQYTLEKANGTNLENGITLQYTLQSGYFYPIGHAVTIQTETEGLDDREAVLTPNGSVGVYVINNIPADCTITITISDAKKLMTVSSKVTEDQVFGTVTTDTATISRDSAFTVYFDVDNYDSTEYKAIKLMFSAALPTGTTVLMLDRNTGIYYWADASGYSSLELTSFVRLGTEEIKFSYGNGSLNLQFVVDFSRADSTVAGDTLTTALTADKADASGAANVQEQAVTSLKDAPSYTLSATGNYGELDYIYTPSAGIASKWKNRDEALVFIPQSGVTLPADAHLLVKNGEATTEIYANSNGEFVYPMLQGGGFITVTLVSGLLPETETEYQFTVEWRSSNSRAEGSPMNGELLRSAELKLKAVRSENVSLKITADKKLYEVGATAVVTVSWADLPPTHELELVLMVKSEDGTYSSTAVTRKIDTKDFIAHTVELEISLAGNSANSYCLVLTAEQGLITVAEAEYYFLIQ